ncbi:MAG: hypothetical protein CUN50_03825 [Candidatus Thermofonsia Clade 1 bacterium]|uniref:DUF4919 domain-containing protein n=1 Tax=Candidatus Thermofonsia Clade 1 bacterium TaxID=2364210 RepID=A0A2M8PY90_9CHLR|nr:MAG: hypothetical protein CUN50_03825 [Candidatus Thermofonsia Clade 1 bacterium]
MLPSAPNRSSIRSVGLSLKRRNFLDEDKHVDYEQLLACALNDLTQVDFTALREAYTRTPHYDPYRSGAIDEQLIALTHAQDWAGAAVLCERLLAADYLHAPLHLVIAYIYQELEDEARATWHLRFARGLIHSLLSSGDGRSPESAFKVITLREEYELLRALSLESLGQRLIAHNERYYDVLSVQDANGAQGEIFFDVTAIIKHARGDSE